MTLLGPEGNEISFLFIAGCQRSGTTALLELVNHDERIVLGRERFKECRRKITPAWFTEERFFNIKKSETNYSAPEFYDKLKDRWKVGSVQYTGDKVPFYYKDLPHLARVFPGCKICFLVRDLHRVAASYNARAENPKDKVWKPVTSLGFRARMDRFFRSWKEELPPLSMDYRRAVFDWNESLVKLRNFVSMGYRNNVFVVRYEDFFCGDERYLEALFDFLDLPLVRQVREKFQLMTQGWESRAARPTGLTPEMVEYLEKKRNREAEAYALALCPVLP